MDNDSAKELLNDFIKRNHYEDFYSVVENMRMVFLFADKQPMFAIVKGRFVRANPIYATPRLYNLLVDFYKETDQYNDQLFEDYSLTIFSLLKYYYEDYFS